MHVTRIQEARLLFFWIWNELENKQFIF